MASSLDSAMAQHPAGRRKQIASKAMELATLKDLRKASKQTQEDLAAALGVGQDTISRLEKRSDMLLSTLRHYVACVGGKLELVATFPDRPPVVIVDRAGSEKASRGKNGRVRAAGRNGQGTH